MSDGASKVYTRGGDQGQTSLIGGARVSKGDLRLESYGTIDELNSMIGLLRAEISAEIPKPDRLQNELTLIQNELFDVGSHLACEDSKIREGLPKVSASEIERLEKSMDEFSAALKPLKNFVLPGGSRSASVAHLARTICRRAERICVRLLEMEPEATEPIVVKYINRLSDFFFVLARHLNHLQKIEEPIWSAKKARA